MNTMDSGRLTLIKRELQRFRGVIEKLIIEIENKIQKIEQNNLIEVFNKHFQTEMIEDEQFTAFVKDFQGLLQVKDNQFMTIEEEYQTLLQCSTVKKIRQYEGKMIEFQQYFKDLKTHPTQLKIVKFCFQENRKHVDITVIDESTIKKTKNGTYAMAYADEGFDPSKQSYEFAFSVQIKAQYVWVGVGNDEGDNVPSYVLLQNKWSNLGHGQYMISYHNYTFHHTDGEINHKAKGMTYKVGDKIQIKYDHLTKVLDFRKESDQQNIIKMPITDMKKILYPCALLYYPDDQVQLVEY